ncbi:hypothetical protein AB1A65_17580 [Muricauda sp. ANG21]|uniref:hypothetical protein n=1 Tax=Allomuricauda sp. ANG21 TaxID=3042468 RepID=UPI00345571A3
MKLSRLLICVLLFIVDVGYSQDQKGNIDPSKPTNLYTQLNTAAEFASGEGYGIYGLRINYQYAINSDNLILAEVPLLYNNSTNKFGLSDIRVRYFHAAKRNLSPKVIAIVPFADVTLPTGSVEKGLGGDTWSVGVGGVVGLALNQEVSLFPGLSYVYLTESGSNGLGLQTNLSYKFNKRTFVFVNPIVTFFDFDTIWQGELNFNHIITPNRFKVNAGWYPNFTSKFDTFRAGCTFYF